MGADPSPSSMAQAHINAVPLRPVITGVYPSYERVGFSGRKMDCF